MVRFAIVFMFFACAAPAWAQDKYDRFVGQYMAAGLITAGCPGFTVLNVPGAGYTAKTENGLREQKVLRLLYYTKPPRLTAVGRYALTERNVNPDDTAALCRFGRQIAEKQDTIGRFLRFR